jgi:hypothetical protein
MIATPKQLMPPDARGAHSLHRLVGCWRRNRLARAIRADRRYFQPLGFGRTNRLDWQIRLLLKAPNSELSSERAAEPQKQKEADARRLLK